MKHLIIYTMAAYLGLSAMVHAEMRIWTSRKGDSVEAEYVKMSGNKVVLKTAAGKTLRVPAEGLCDDDREYLAHAAAVPPKIQIEVDEDVEIDKQARGYYMESEEQKVSCSVVIKKTNPEPCFDQFKAYLFLIAEEKEGSTRKIIGINEQSIAFANQDTVKFSLNAQVVSDSGYDWANGFEYEGYLVCVQNETGQTVAMKSSQNAYERHARTILKAKKDDLFTEDFAKAN